MQRQPFRIFEERDDQGAVLALHGWLTEPVVQELSRVLAEAGPSVRLELSELLGADDAGLVALLGLRKRGVQLSGASPYFELRFAAA